MNRLLFTLLIAAIAGFAQSPQVPAEKPGFKLRVERSMPRPHPEPQEGDKFQLDPATGDLLIARRDARRGRARRIDDGQPLHGGEEELAAALLSGNEEKFLPHLLLSLTKQTKQDFEVIVVDGSSTDRTVEVANSFAAQ